MQFAHHHPVGSHDVKMAASGGQLSAVGIIGWFP